MKQERQQQKIDGKQYKKGEKYQAEYNIGYGYRLESAIKEIVYQNLGKKEDVVSLEKFLELFNEENDRLHELLKHASKT